MAYSDFTPKDIQAKLHLRIYEADALFGDVPSVQPSGLLKELLNEHIPLATFIATEKARSELLIAPVLVEVRRLLRREVSLFSGVSLTVDAEQGLTGICDFLFTRSPQFIVAAPVVAVVEAKNENIVSGLGQCAAELVAAQRLNQHEGYAQERLYGCVTSGTVWKFLYLHGTNLAIDRDEYTIQQPGNILGIFQWMLQSPP